MNGFEGCYPAGLCDDDVSIVKIGFNIMDVAQNMDALKTVFQFLPELFVFPAISVISAGTASFSSL